MTRDKMINLENVMEFLGFDEETAISFLAWHDIANEMTSKASEIWTEEMSVSDEIKTNARFDAYRYVVSQVIEECIPKSSNPIVRGVEDGEDLDNLMRYVFDVVQF